MSLVEIAPIETKLESYSPFLEVAILFLNFLRSLKFLGVKEFKIVFTTQKYKYIMSLVETAPISTNLEFYSPFSKVAILFFNSLETLHFLR